MMQKVIMDEVASDPDAVSPEPGAWPMFIRYPEEEIDLSNIWSMFGITSGGGDIEQSGVSFQAWDICLLLPININLMHADILFRFQRASWTDYGMTSKSEQPLFRALHHNIQ